MLDRLQKGPGLTAAEGGGLNVLSASSIVQAASDGDFADILPGDILYFSIDGDDEVRTVISVDHDANPDELVISSMLGDEDLSALDYDLARRVFAVEDDNRLVAGGGAQEIEFIAESSLGDATVEASSAAGVSTVVANGENGAYLSATSGEGSESRVVLRTTANKGWVFSRKGNATTASAENFTIGEGVNQLTLSRHSDSVPGSTIDCGISSTTVQATDSSAFDSVRVGDSIVISIDDVEISREVTAISSSQQLTIKSPFSRSVAVETQAYWISRDAIVFDDEDSMTLGGATSSGSKTLNIASGDSDSSIEISAQGDSALTLSSQHTYTFSSTSQSELVLSRASASTIMLVSPEPSGAENIELGDSSNTDMLTINANTTTVSGNLALESSVSIQNFLVLGTETVSAAASIEISSSHVVVSSDGNSEANSVSVRGVVTSGTALFVTNEDEDALTGEVSCPATTRCLLVFEAGSNSFETFSEMTIS